jgi:hypothetical protein
MASRRPGVQESRLLVLGLAPGRGKAGDGSAGQRDLPGRSIDLAITARPNDGATARP